MPSKCERISSKRLIPQMYLIRFPVDNCMQNLDRINEKEKLFDVSYKQYNSIKFRKTLTVSRYENKSKQLITISEMKHAVICHLIFLAINIICHSCSSQGQQYKRVRRVLEHGDQFEIDSDETCSTFNAKRINGTLLDRDVSDACQCSGAAPTLFFKRDGSLCLQNSSK